jgi:hypothetical protein
MHVKVVAQWVPSISPNVSVVEFVWSVNGVELPPVSLSPDVSFQELTDVDGKLVSAKVTVIGVNGLRSDSVVAKVQVPEHPVVPEPVTGLTLNVISVG